MDGAIKRCLLLVLGYRFIFMGEGCFFEVRPWAKKKKGNAARLALMKRLAPAMRHKHCAQGSAGCSEA